MNRKMKLNVELDYFVLVEFFLKLAHQGINLLKAPCYFVFSNRCSVLKLN